MARSFAVCVDGHHQQIGSTGHPLSDRPLVEIQFLHDPGMAATGRTYAHFDGRVDLSCESSNQRTNKPLVRRILGQQVHYHGLLVDQTTKDEALEQAVLPTCR